MGYKKCPACDINWILDDAEVCEVCRGKNGQSNQNYFSKPKVKHQGRNIFWVFQGKEFLKELSQGYLLAPCKDAGGKVPSHWAMLNNVNKDISYSMASRKGLLLLVLLLLYALRLKLKLKIDLDTK